VTTPGVVKERHPAGSDANPGAGIGTAWTSSALGVVAPAVAVSTIATAARSNTFTTGTLTITVRSRGYARQPMTAMADRIPDRTIELLDHGFVRLDDAMADDLSVVNGARVSFARRKTEMDESDEALIRFLMRDRHGSPFEHNAFRFHIRCPIFVAREWFRHRVGCLTGDTIVTFLDTNGHGTRARAKTIDELWRMWTEGERDGHASSAELYADIDRLHASGMSQRAMTRTLGGGRRAVRARIAGANGMRDARWRVRGMPLRVLDESTGEFTVGHIADVVDKGVQPVYLLTLADGKQLTLTENHRVLTEDGWKLMGDAVGLLGRGANARMTEPCALMVNGTMAHRDRDWLTARRREETELAFAREHSGRIGLVTEGTVPTRKGFALTAHQVQVVGLSFVGLRQTYDLSVAGPWHNFVANGVVVHNSFNEFSLRYAKATEDFYVPEADDVRTQVGKPGAYSFEQVEPELAEHTREKLREVYDAAFGAYEELVEAGVARELARSVLPVGAYTQFYWTVNARSLMNFISLRNAQFAQLEIRRYAEAVEAFFAELMPITYDSFVEGGRVAP
jgi:thymidylate synthase (FAD)